MKRHHFLKNTSVVMLAGLLVLGGSSLRLVHAVELETSFDNTENLICKEGHAHAEECYSKVEEKLSEDISGVDINEKTFPDSLFREYVARFDSNKDKILSFEEIENILEINVSSKGIKSIQGVEFFTALEVLDCYDNQINKLDVSKNTQLLHLNCRKNPTLQELDVSQNGQLKKLWCNENKSLAVLNLKGAKALEELICNDNFQLTQIDTRHNKALKKIDAYNSGLISLDLSQNLNLDFLDCGATAITQLELKANKKLEVLHFDDTKIKKIDLSQNTELEELWFYNTGIGGMDLRNHTKLIELDCSGTTPLAWLHIGPDQGIWKIIELPRPTIDIGTVKSCFDIQKLFPGIEPNRIQEIEGAGLDKATGIVSGYQQGTPIVYKYLCGEAAVGEASMQPVILTVTLTFDRIYECSYEFVCNNAGTSLPEKVLSCLPVDEATYAHGTTVTPQAPHTTSVAVDGGVWNFVEWDKKSQIANADIMFTGIWEFSPNSTPIEPNLPTHSDSPQDIIVPVVDKTPNKTNVLKTADATNIGILVGLLGVSFGIIVVMVKRSQKRHNT